MSQYLLIKKILVQNANAISGLTYGFPAITHFLGFAHALSRKLPENSGMTLGGVGVVSHQTFVHARQPKGWGDYVFALSRNPLTKEGATAPINEEGRMQMQVSLLIEIEGLQAGDVANAEALRTCVESVAPTMRLAGGQITEIQNVRVIMNDEQETVLRRLMPGTVLVDRNDYLQNYYSAIKQHDENACLFEAWCDFVKLKFQAEAIEDEPGKAHWHYVPKPQPGYLVPIMAGYRAISPLYEAGEVANARDDTVPACFAEAAYSIAEWRSLHRISDPQEIIWRYECEFPWYLARNKPVEENVVSPDFLEQEMTF